MLRMALPSLGRRRATEAPAPSANRHREKYRHGDEFAPLVASANTVPPMKTLRHGLLIGAMLALGCAAQGQIIVFNFNSGTPLVASTVNSNLASVTNFTVSDGSFTSTAFTTGTPPDSPAVADSGSWDAASPTKYFSFSFTPTSGYSVAITGISFDYRQTPSGALNYQIDVGSNTSVASGVFTRDSTWRQLSHSSITLSGLINSNEVRIFGYGGGTGSFGIDRVTITGSVTAIPEPSTYAAILGAVVLAGVAIRRCRLQHTA